MAGAGTSKEQQLSCPECSKVFLDESELLAHILNHPEQEKCSCELCEEKFDYEGQLFEHVITHKEDILVVPKARQNLKEKALLIEDENCKKGIGIISPCVPNIDNQLVDDNEELEALVTKSRISNQVKGISINVLDKSSIEKDNGSQNYLTNVKDELSLEIDNAFKEGKHDEPYFTKADVKDLQIKNFVSEKHFLTNIGQEVPLTIDSVSEEGKHTKRFLTKAAEKDLQTPNDDYETTSLNIAKRILPKRVSLICREKIEKKDQIEAHAPNHSVNMSYICGICCEQFNVKTKLEKHFSTHTKEECQIYTSSMEVLKKCIKTGPFNRKTRQISLFEKHQLKSQSPESTPYVCRICFKRFEDIQQLKKHSLMHTKNKHLCQMCFKGFKTRHQLIAHSVTHETKTEAPLACQVCFKQYPTEKQLQKHFRTHTDMFTHKCQECDKVFANRANLRNHMGYHTRPHVCNVCGDSFPQKSFLRLHKFAHSQEEQMQSVSNDESLYTCEICRKVFNTKRELLKHCVLHGGENFDCGVCGKSFSNAVNLRVHFVIHEDKIFPCLECDKKFPQKQQLISHSITHTIEKNFCCGTCGKAFKRRGNLRLHCLSHKDDTECCIEILKVF